MSDQPAAPPPQPRPRPRPQGQPRPPQSRESKFIGYLVLGFGILAVVAVLLLAFMGSSDGPAEPPVKTEAQVQKTEEIKQDTAATRLIEAPKPVVPTPEKSLFFKREPDLDVSAMDGNWQTMIGPYTAILQMNKDVYQVILASDDPMMPRYYSSGQYKVLEDMVTFTPRMDWPVPATTSGFSNYQTVTRAPFALVVAFQSGKMMMQNIPPDEERARRIFKTPLFMGEDVDYVVWDRIE